MSRYGYRVARHQLQLSLKSTRGVIDNNGKRGINTNSKLVKMDYTTNQQLLAIELYIEELSKHKTVDSQGSTLALMQDF